MHRVLKTRLRPDRVPLGVMLRFGAYWILTLKPLRGTTRRVGEALANTGRLRFRNDPRYNGERQLQSSALQLVETSDEEIWVVDVGANIGEWSLALVAEAHRLGVADRLGLVALEPTTAAFTELRKNLSGVELRTVELRQCAASDMNGTASINVYGPSFGINSLEPSPADDDIPVVGAENVQTVTLSSLVDELGIDRLHLLKIDTEGHDLTVLTGAMDLFDQETIWIAQFEYNRRWIPGRHFLHDVFELFDGTPYVLGFLTPRGVVWTPLWDSTMEDWYETNYIVVHRLIASDLPAAT